MFIGHFAVALAAKKVAPKTSLGTLMLSTGFVDVLWPFFVMFGWEHVRIDPGNTAFTPLDFYDYPWTHSLVAGVFWAAVFGGISQPRELTPAERTTCFTGSVCHLIAIIERSHTPVPGPGSLL